MVTVILMGRLRKACCLSSDKMALFDVYMNARIFLRVVDYSRVMHSGERIKRI